MFANLLRVVGGLRPQAAPRRPVEWLTEQLLSMKREKFGKKSEGWETAEQLVLPFNEVETVMANPDPSEPADLEIVEVQGHTKKIRGHRKPLPEHLTREVIEVELPVSEQVNEQGEQLRVIGWEVSEKLKYEPAKISVLQYRRAKYGTDSGDYEKMAPLVPSVLPKSMATPELLAAIVVAKYADGLPLYRIEEIFRRHGVELSRTTMARWMMLISEALVPILNVLEEKLFSSHAIACDETSVQVLKEDGRAPEAKSWMIVRANPADQEKVVLFDYQVSRSQEVIKDLLAGYTGNLLCDGLNGYNAVPGVLRFGCHMHARRRFEKAANDGAKSGKSLAAEVMRLYKMLYDFEEQIKDKPPDEKVKARLQDQEPILKAIKQIVDDNIAKVPDKSHLGEAFRYYQNEYPQLTRYLTDGQMPPDNGFAERAIRKFAIGRNNWIFSDTPEGAHASALLYSLVITAKLNGVNPYKAMVKILTEIPKMSSADSYEALAQVILKKD